MFALTFYDAKAIKAAGANPQGKTLVPFMLLTPLGYLWRRAAVTGTNYYLLWIWLGCAVAYLVIQAALLIEV